MTRYEQGFMKRAEELGVSSSDAERAFEEWQKKRRKERLISLILTGGLIGGVTGGPIGAGVGTGAGALAALAANAYAKKDETMKDMIEEMAPNVK